jgi:hypothetical protein
MTGIRSRLTYANLTSTLALLVALGGGAAVAAGHIDGHQIKKGTIASKQIKNGGVAGKDLAPGALAGLDAASVDGRSAGCGAGTLEYVGGCWEASSNPPASWTQAATVCADRGGGLPSIGALTIFAIKHNISLNAEWVDDLSYDSSVVNVRTFKVTSPFQIENETFGGPHGYRCVLPLVH